MAPTQKSTFHVRSTSLPSISHPLVVNIEDHLCALRATEATLSESSVCKTLNNLKKLYESVDEMMQLRMTQQGLSQEANGKWTEEILDGSLRLLDVCSTAKNVLLHTKESTQDLRSSLRRRRGTGSDLAADAESYMVSRKMTKKIAFKCIKNIKNAEKKSCPSTLSGNDENLVSTVNMLREVEAISLSTFKSLLYYASGTHVDSKKSGWSLVSKLVQAKHESCKTEMSDLESLIGKLNKQKSSEDIEFVMNRLERSELAIQELENGLDSVFKCLMKTRVSILNMLN